MHIMLKLVRPLFVSTEMFIPVSFCVPVVTHSIYFNFINMVDVVEIQLSIFLCFSVLVYLALYRLDELGIAHFRKFVVSHEANKMFKVRVKKYL